MTKKPKLLMLKGLPASGKSTYARELITTKGYARLNKDDIRKMMHNSKWSKKNEAQVIEFRNNVVFNLLQEGNDVVVDDTNFAPQHQQDLMETAKEANASFEVLFIDTPLEECISRNEKRADKVPLNVITGMYDKYIRPLRQKQAPEYNDELEECIIVDVDGTLAHISGDNPRSPYDASRAHEDILDDAVSNIVSMAYGHGYKVIVLTGRHSGHLDVTQAWLEANGVEYDEIYCRQEGDRRKDTEVKEELYNKHIAGKYNVKYILDDRPSVCRMWRGLGLKTLQVGDPHVEF